MTSGIGSSSGVGRIPNVDMVEGTWEGRNDEKEKGFYRKAENDIKFSGQKVSSAINALN